jgi:hypothetical protein
MRDIWVNPETGGVESTVEWRQRFSAGDPEAHHQLAELDDPYREAEQGWVAVYEAYLMAPRRKGKVVHADRDCPALSRTGQTKRSSIRRAMVYELQYMAKCQRCW